MSPKSHSTNARRSGKGAEKLLGELELAVMRVAWSRPSVTVREVLAVLVKKRPLAYTTVMTIMSRLSEKGLLLTEKKGKTYTYRAAHTQAEYESFAAGRVVQALLTDFGGEIALSQFVKQLAHTDPEQLARLASLARQAGADSHDA